MPSKKVVLMPAIIGVGMVMRPAAAYVQQMRIDDQRYSRNKQYELKERENLFEHQKESSQ